MRSLKRSHSQGGFTLVELLITVALIGVLATIAIPNFLAYQARSRRSEAYANLTSLARSYKAYGAEKGIFPDMGTVTAGFGAAATSLPDYNLYGGLGTRKLPWDADTQRFFNIVGFQVEGSVFYTYDVAAPGAGSSCTCIMCFTATAHGDVDGDGLKGQLMYAMPQRDGSGNVIGECPSGADPSLWAPTYDEVAWNTREDLY